MLKDYFTPAYFFSALLFRQAAWKVSLFKVGAFKRENARYYRTSHRLQHLQLLILEVAVPEFPLTLQLSPLPASALHKRAW